jgi:hypothetical protein
MTVHGFMRFRPDSVVEMRLPVSSKQGVYRLTGDSLVFFMPGGDTSRCAMSLRGDTLELTRTFTNGTFTFRYLRAGKEAWYYVDPS